VLIQLDKLEVMVNMAPFCIIGNLNIDLIIRNVPGLPLWGQEVMGTSHSHVSSGQAGYLAFALSRLGVPVGLVANVGEDLNGQQIVRDLRSYGIDTRGVGVTPGGQTGISIAIVRTDGERAFVSDLGCLWSFTETNIRSSWQMVEDAEVVCLVGLFCLPGLTFDGAARQLGAARQAGKTTMLDTGWDPRNWPEETRAGMRLLLNEVSLFMPNWDEARAITGQDTLEDAARELLSWGPEIVVIKCGDQGSFAFRAGYSCQARPRAVVVQDAVGAGDVFNAGFLYSLWQDRPLPDCLAFGNTIASMYISRTTDRFPSLAEVTQAAGDILDQRENPGD
jgi:ribokinase